MTRAGSADFDYDWLVIGSGFGGSVSALRLTEKGYRVGVLECGRRFADHDLPRSTWDVRRYFWAPRLGLRGIFRVSAFKDVTVVSGSGVGGGSLGYANTLYVPPRRFFDDPQWAALDDDWQATLAPHYAEAERMLGVTDYDEDDPADQLLRELGEDLGVGDTYSKTRVGVFLGAGRRDRARSLLRRRRSGPDRLHALRPVHGGVPVRREEHSGQELPLVRAATGRGGHRRARGGRDPAARRRGRQRRLPRRHRAPRRLAAQAPARVHRPRRRRGRRRARHQPAAAALPPRRLAAARLPSASASSCARTARRSSPSPCPGTTPRT